MQQDKWESVPAEELGPLREGISRLVQHVYEQSGQLTPSRGVSSYYSTVHVGYRLSHPSTSYVNVAKGEGPLRSRVIFSIDAHKRTVKFKGEGDWKVPLSTAKFDKLLDSITEAVHTSHQERAEALIIERRLELKAEADRLANAAAREQAERDSAHTAQLEEERIYQHKLALLLTKLEAVIKADSEPRAKKQKMEDKTFLDIECNGHSYDEDAASDTPEETSAANCKCGSFKDFCAAKDCVSMFCPESTAVDDRHFQQCGCCNKAYCASHMHCIKVCCQCQMTLCYEQYQCGICEETLCEGCCSGIHEEECMMKHASADEPLSEAEIRIWSTMAEEADQEGYGEDYYDFY